MTRAQARRIAVGSLLAVLVAGGAVWLLSPGRADSRHASLGASAGGGATAPDYEPGTGVARAPALRDPLPSAEPPFESEAKRLTRLAETSEDPRVVEASFDAILSTYAARSTRKPGPDADLERAILKHVGSARATTALAALKAARIALMAEKPRAGVTQALVELAAPAQPSARRYAAFDGLNLIRPNRRDETVLRAFEQGLSAREPELVSYSLLALSQSRPSLEALPEGARSGLTTRVVALLDHYDAGVRGNALLVLSEVPALVPLESRHEAAKRALTDREPYVRARAAELLSRCREPAAIHLLIEHVRDLAPARYELRGFTQLDGSAGGLVHEVPGRKRVAEAALFSILSLSRQLEGASELALTLGGQPAPDELVLENATLARTWYGVHRANIPLAQH